MEEKVLTGKRKTERKQKVTEQARGGEKGEKGKRNEIRDTLCSRGNLKKEKRTKKKKIKLSIGEIGE